MSDGYYLKILNPVVVRRNVLESSELLLHNLRGFSKIMMTRDEKEKQIDILRRHLREIDLLMERLQENVPRDKLQRLLDEAPEDLREELLAIMDGRAKPKEPKHDPDVPMVEPYEVAGGVQTEEGSKKETGETILPSTPSKDHDLQRLEDTLRSVKDELKKLE